MKKDKDGNGEQRHQLKTEGREEADAWLSHHAYETSARTRIADAFSEIDQKERNASLLAAVKNKIAEFEEKWGNDKEAILALTVLRDLKKEFKVFDVKRLEPALLKGLAGRIFMCEEAIRDELSNRFKGSNNIPEHYERLHQKRRMLSSLRMELEKASMSI